MNPREIELGMLLARFAAFILGITGAAQAATALKTVRFEIVRDAPYTVLEMVHPQNRSQRMPMIRHKSRATVVRFKERLLERLEHPDDIAELILFAPTYAGQTTGVARR